MFFERFCRNSVAPAPRRAGGTALRALGLSIALLPLAGPSLTTADAAGTADRLVTVGSARVIPPALRQARPMGRLPSGADLKVAVTLPWRDAAGLDDFIRHATDPKDPAHGKFLTHAQFVARFSPSQDDYDAVKAWATASGLSVAATSPNRMMLAVTGKRDAVESAFHVQFNRFQLATGRVVYLNDTLPKLPQSIAARVSHVVGLNDYLQLKPHYQRKNSGGGLRPAGVTANATVGNGPDGGLTPADIRSVYDITPLETAGLNGSGQTVALYEQNGYLTSDITEYATFYNLGTPNLQNIPIAGYDGTVTDPDTQGEVTLDIDMILAVAPAAKILVYEFDVTQSSSSANPFVLQTKIIDDDLASVISFSYGGAEDAANLDGYYQAENQLYKQMMSQGQCMFASSGDDGAYTTGVLADGVSVSDPASQPLIVGVGGTSLNSAPTVKGVATYGTETTWVNPNGDPADNDGGGGGGISTVWTIPNYQTGAVTGATAANKISTTMRNVPDVSLNADPGTGYSVFLADSGGATAGGATGFIVVGGTSASCPLWAAFNILVNQQRAIYGLDRLGFANPYIYAAAEGTGYKTEFHDINDGSNNLFYPAVTGFDDATGWGSFDATLLLPEFAPSTFGSTSVNVSVVDAGGNPFSGAAVVLTTPLIPEFSVTVQSGADGSANFPVSVGIHNYNNSGEDVTLSYSVSATAPGYAGESRNDITPPTAAPIVLRILPPDHTYTGGTLQMISAPFDYSTVGDFATLFGLSLPVGTTSGSAQLFAYSPTLTAYLKYPTAPADTLRLGQGYWAVLPSSAYVRRKGVAAPTNQSFRINLLPGWNMIGDPFPSSVSISNIQVDTVVAGSPVGIGSASTVQLPFYYYNGSAYQTLTTGNSLQPFQGYWVHASQPAELVIPVP